MKHCFCQVQKELRANEISSKNDLFVTLHVGASGSVDSLVTVSRSRKILNSIMQSTTLSVVMTEIISLVFEWFIIHSAVGQAITSFS